MRLRQESGRIRAQTAEPVEEWRWLRDYLQVDVQLADILATFPDDEPMRRSVESCRGLRLLRQEPWECLASFICSSTKQITQIQQIISLLCQRFGESLAVPAGVAAVRAFPTAARLAAATEGELRECKLGFRAPYLAATARKLARGEVELARLPELPLEQARAQLITLPGVGVKIANCVLLFAYGFPRAFPVDVWISRGLRQLYFPKRRPKLARLLRFSQTHFGPHSGYAQQYLFHYLRTQRRFKKELAQ